MTSSHEQYLAHLAEQSGLFARALARAGDDDAVPTCPDWTAADLLWHLTGVQRWWAQAVLVRPEEPVWDGDAPRPADLSRAELTARSATALAALTDALASTDPAEPCWSWAPGGDTVGWVARRQAHEALVHRLDAELTVGARTPVDPVLAADGVDEVLRFFWCGTPPWTSARPVPGRALRFAAVDVGRTWDVTSAVWSGTSPNTGTTYTDEPTLVLVEPGLDSPDPVPDAVVSGTAEDLDCLLWNRPAVGQVRREGDPAALEGLDALLRQGLQ